MSKENIGSRIELADGHTMPQEGLGVYRMTDEAELIQSVKSAYDDGYRLFDTAQMYGNEGAVGQAIKELNVAGMISSSPQRLLKKIRAMIKQSLQ